MKLKINTDGGSRGNPGPAAAGIVIFDTSTQALVHQFGQTIGRATNNIAEYQAVVLALEWLIKSDLKPDTINFFLDSALVVNQMNGLWRVKDAALRQKIILIRSLEASLHCPIQYTAIPREQNTSADTLVNQALDNKL